jgi:hypothetical protein
MERQSILNTDADIEIFLFIGINLSQRRESPAVEIFLFYNNLKEYYMLCSMRGD